MKEIRSLVPEQFPYVIEEVFTTQLTNGTSVELKANGSAIPVTYENCQEFCNLVIQARLHESDRQIIALKKGFHSIVPQQYLALFSWYEVELLVCGSPNIDIDNLRRHTHYQNGFSVSHPIVKCFFKVLESFSMEERQVRNNFLLLLF